MSAHSGHAQGNYSAAYEELLSRYTNVVVGQLFGHQHSGSFRLLRAPSTSATPPYGAPPAGSEVPAATGIGAAAYRVSFCGARSLGHHRPRDTRKASRCEASWGEFDANES